MAIDTAHLPEIAALASGGGTTIQALIEGTECGLLKAKVGLVICNNSNAGVFNVIERANLRGKRPLIRILHISGKTHPAEINEIVEEGAQSQAEGKAIYELTKDFMVVALAGYMKKVIESDERWINIHPAPLPQTAGFYGKYAQEEALRQGMAYSASTIQRVAPEYDIGETISEVRVPILPSDTPETLNQAVMATEKLHLIRVINGLVEAV